MLFIFHDFCSKSLTSWRSSNRSGRENQTVFVWVKIQPCLLNASLKLYQLSARDSITAGRKPNSNITPIALTAFQSSAIQYSHPLLAGWQAMLPHSVWSTRQRIILIGHLHNKLNTFRRLDWYACLTTAPRIRRPTARSQIKTRDAEPVDINWPCWRDGADPCEIHESLTLCPLVLCQPGKGGLLLRIDLSLEQSSFVV